ncbi:DUF600 family protein [Paenibacillus spiritus]|uniref:DUF600 family protein n=1 Tax=Paenibacillus spiritus TaxID=2496557 RepID=A0A5J5G569_9BACL|nr:immunity protein YezG family protein [Paenibacillus spiritus]KAA9002082.1 DUF600 family protein [Paenibacillus spiritus]
MEILFQKIANILNSMIPEDWDRVSLYAEVREGFSQVFFYYYPIGSDKPIYSLDILDISSVDKRKHRELKHQLYEFFEELWNEFKVQEQEQWTSLTYLLDISGKMKVNYGYEDISLLSPVKKQEKWEAEYLR